MEIKHNNSNKNNNNLLKQVAYKRIEEQLAKAPIFRKVIFEVEAKNANIELHNKKREKTSENNQLSMF